MVALSCSMVSSWYIRRDSRPSMRSESSCSLMTRVFPGMFLCFLGTLAQAMAKCDALVEHETFASPAALGFRHFLQILQDATLEMIDLGKSLGEQKRTRLLAADAARAEHRDPLMPGRIKPACGKFLELPEPRDVRVQRAFERAHRDFEGIAGVDDKRIGRRDQRVPVVRLDIDADLTCRIGHF